MRLYTAFFLPWLPFAFVIGCTQTATGVSMPITGIETTAAFSGGAAASGQVISATRWWTSLGSAQLDQMVETFENGNPDLAAASLRVIQREIELLNTRGQRLPTGSVTQSSTVTSATDLNGTRDTSTSGNLTANVAWEVDLWGRIAAEGDGASARLLAASYDRDALANTLIASLIRNYIAAAFDQRQIAATRRIIASREATLTVVRDRFAIGVEDTTAGTVQSAEENLAAAQADLPDQQLSLVQHVNRIDVLLGRVPVSRDRYGITLPERPPARLDGTGLPTDLLRRRPDIRAAEAQLRAANADISVSIADRFPSLTLRGTLQSNGDDLDTILDIDNVIASLAADLALTVFDGGRGSRLVALRQAQADELARSYVATVLEAVLEVENALAAERLLRQRAGLLQTRLQAARQATTIARDRYQQGTGSYLTLLDASRSEVNAENAYLLVQRDRWTTQVDLMLALGGSWLSENGEVTQ